jgi:hypothetical protein
MIIFFIENDFVAICEKGNLDYEIRFCVEVKVK